MKYALTAFLAGLGLVVANTAYAQSAEQNKVNQLAAATSKCLTESAPAGWDLAVVTIDRSNPAKPQVISQVRVGGQIKDIPVCDLSTQFNLVLGFAQLVPANQQGWKQLSFRTDNKGAYSVMTDIAIAEARKK
jgi:uncharacterized linocin/CFP29 family protein